MESTGTAQMELEKTKALLQKSEEALKDATFKLDAATSRLETLANIDALTEVLNRIGLERALQSEFNRAPTSGVESCCGHA